MGFSFLDAITDINANICRNVITAISHLKSEEQFISTFCPKLATLTFNLLDIIEKFNTTVGKYKVNKEVFKLYWCLETMYEFWDKMDFKELKTILLRAKEIQEYTIREKVAKILSLGFEDEELKLAQQKLKNDENYYVKRL